MSNTTDNKKWFNNVWVVSILSTLVVTIIIYLASSLISIRSTNDYMVRTSESMQRIENLLSKEMDTNSDIKEKLAKKMNSVDYYKEYNDICQRVVKVEIKQGK